MARTSDDIESADMEIVLPDARSNTEIDGLNVEIVLPDARPGLDIETPDVEIVLPESLPPAEEVLGQRVDAVSLDQAVRLVLERTHDDRGGAYVCLTNVHTTIEAQSDEALRQAARAAYLSVPDGMPLVWILRRRGWRHTEKVTGIEFIPRVATSGLAAETRHFFYGGAPGVAELAGRGLQRMVPGTEVAGALTAPFSDGVDWDLSELQEALARTKPDILWVGLGAPKQEIWMHRAASQLGVPIAIGVGAAFDYLAGTKAPAPRILSRMGLEWLYRLLREPRRLWRRYLVGNSRFVYLLLAQRFRRQSHP